MFDHPERRKAMEAAMVGLHFVGGWLTEELETLRKTTAARAKGNSGADLRVLERQLKFHVGALNRIPLSRDAPPAGLEAKNDF